MSLAAQLPALPVLLPLVAAACVAVVRSPRAAWSITAITLWACFALAVLMAGGTETFSYALGGHLPPIGIEYRLDDLGRYLLLLVTFLAAVMIPYARTSIAHELPEEKQPLFYTLLLLCIAGMLGIILTGDIFNIYVFLEISSLSLYALIALGSERQALVAAIRYLIPGTIGATFFLLGVFFLYAATGTLNITDMAQRLPDAADARPVIAGFAFLMLGLFLKLAVFPLHRWLIGAYTHAPSFVAAFAAACGTKVMACLLIRFAYTLFGFNFTFEAMQLAPVLLVLALAGILAGTWLAIRQQNVRRMLAYSSIAQMGYILLGLSLASEAGLAASLAHLANHALAKGALFLAAGCVFFRMGGVSLKHFAGLGRQMKWTMAAFMLTGFSLIGVPGTAGFISKWMLLSALIEQGDWLLFACVLAASFAAVLYLWKIAEAAYFHKPSTKKPVAEAPLMLLIPTWILALANIWFGLSTHWTARLATDAATQLMAGG